MTSSGLLYRLSQKWKYHFSGDTFEKKVAEINRNGAIISLSESSFFVSGSPLTFSRQHHAFIVDQLDLFTVLMKGRGSFLFKNQDLIYHIDGVALRISTAEEIFIVYEIFFDRCYNVIAPWRYEVIDIGMNVGFASLFFANNEQVVKVNSFEPFNPTYRDAQINIALNPLLQKKIALHNAGLGARNEKRTLNYSSDLKGKNTIHQSHGGREEIELKDAFEIVDQIVHSGTGKFFIKMDCEGAEFDIFENLNKHQIHSEIFGFVIEWHFKNPKPIVDVLIANQFKVQLTGNDEIGLITAFR